MRIASVASALPEHEYDQHTLTRYLAQNVWKDDPGLLRRLEGMHDHVKVERRHLAYPIERYAELLTFGDFNRAWIPAALELGERAVRAALARAGVVPSDVDAIFFSTVTGVASPSIDAMLVNRLGFRPDVKRLPLFGLGCVAGAAAVSRAVDYVRAFPRGVALVLTIELCSLTLQRSDRSIANVIASGLFGDGASASVVVGRERESRGSGQPRVLATRSIFYPDTEDVMGWDVSEAGFRIVLSSAVPTMARENLGRDVDSFLADWRLTRRDVKSWVCHPGGPKVLEATRDALSLNDEDLAASWDCLRRAGNLSSVSVLLVLEATLLERRPEVGALGIMLAMGPGFCSELLLLEW